MKTITADQAAMRILLNGKLTEKQRQAQLSALATKVRNVMDNRVKCPECGNKGPHEDNGATRSCDLTFLCTDCGTQFDAESVLS